VTRAARGLAHPRRRPIRTQPARRLATFPRGRSAPAPQQRQRTEPPSGRHGQKELALRRKRVRPRRGACRLAADGAKSTRCSVRAQRRCEFVREQGLLAIDRSGGSGLEIVVGVEVAELGALDERVEERSDSVACIRQRVTVCSLTPSISAIAPYVVPSARAASINRTTSARALARRHPPGDRPAATASPNAFVLDVIPASFGRRAAHVTTRHSEVLATPRPMTLVACGADSVPDLLPTAYSLGIRLTRDEPPFRRAPCVIRRARTLLAKRCGPGSALATLVPSRRRAPSGPFLSSAVLGHVACRTARWRFL
jgi:hypothetical protein